MRGIFSRDNVVSKNSFHFSWDGYMKRFPLPESLRKAFALHAQAVPLEAVAGLNQEVDACVERFHAFKDQFLAPNVKLAEELAERCRYLLGRYKQSNEKQQALIVGAIKYFSLFRDAVPDGKPIVGLDDDIAVTNFVLEELGIKGMFLTVE